MVSKKNNENERSIAKIEMRIEEIRSGPNPKTKANIAEIKRLQSVLNKVYVEYKQKVMAFEEENYSHLVFLRSTHGFYKLFGHSLFFYAFDIAPKINIDAKIYSDGDYEAKSEVGVISVRSLDEIQKKLKSLKIVPIKTEDKTGNAVFFKIPWKYEKKELEKFTEENTYKLNKYNQVIIAENINPTLFLNLNDFLKIAFENVRRLDPVARETLGNLIVELGAEMIRIYIEMTNGRLSEEVALKNIRGRLNKIKSQVKILTDLKLWNSKTYARIGKVIIKIQEIVELQLKKNE